MYCKLPREFTMQMQDLHMDGGSGGDPGYAAYLYSG